jgi:site-specific DNA-methyltransferase (adenine-specific)
MAENTDHPTQKPEKLIAKLLLASSRPGDRVLDPFLGSGTTAAVSCKLGRHWIGIECDPAYCCLAERRVELAAEHPAIQGYRDGVFWDRNAAQGLAAAKSERKARTESAEKDRDDEQRLLFREPRGH